MAEHEIYRHRSRSSKLSFSGGELKAKEADDSFGIAVRALHEMRLGFAYCQREEDLARALVDAEKISKFSRESGFSFPSETRPAGADILDEHIDPENYAGMRAIVDEAREAAESGGGKSRIICSFSRDAVSIENTAGLFGSYEKTSFSLYAECMNGDGFGFAYAGSTRLPKDTESIGKKAGAMAKSMQNAGKPEDGLYTVVMEVEALENIIETVMPSFSGDWKRRAITKLEKGKKMFSDKLTLSDSPLDGAAARPFDDEGTSSAPKVLVEKGVVENFLFDRETAALSGIPEGGSCARSSYDSLPAIAPSNLVVSPGDWEDLGQLGRHIELHSAHGSHTANVTSGDIGLEASSAFVVDKGQRMPVKGFMLSGNVFDMLSNIVGIEKKQRVYGSLISPRIAFGGLRVVT